jgi:hypothetical protein
MPRKGYKPNLTIMKTDTAKEKIGADLKQNLADNVKDMANAHLEAWKDRYATISLKQLKTDLYVNHDPSLEIERIEETIGRKLNEREYDYAVEQFNKAVIKIRS